MECAGNVKWFHWWFPVSKKEYKYFFQINLWLLYNFDTQASMINQWVYYNIELLVKKNISSHTLLLLITQYWSYIYCCTNKKSNYIPIYYSFIVKMKLNIFVIFLDTFLFLSKLCILTIDIFFLWLYVGSHN